ncbi:phenylacetate--CoA ligase family protein, partial [bacterium]|nr:phenylacetate--CoA ligase family protein [bacterium]
MRETRFWNPFFETLPRDDLVQIEIGRFRKVMASAMEKTPMYREKFREAGVSPDDINELDDLRKLPLTEKNELRQAQECDAPYLYGRTLGADLTELSTFHQTSGTTGRPVYVPDTYKSWQWRIEPWTSMLYMMGFRETDRVFIPFG